MCPSFLPGSRHCLYLYFFCCVGFADSACPMTFGRVATVQPKAVTLVNPLASFVRQDVVPNAVNIKKHRLTPLERELEAVEGISLTELGQPVPEVLGRVSIHSTKNFRNGLSPTTASRARFHPQLWQCFVDRSWPDKELVVVETYHGFIMVSLYNLRPFFKALRWWTLVWNTLGSNVQSVRTSQWVPSQNLTILLASGQYCVNFDDDDLYADRYVEHVVTAMQQRNLVALGLDPLRLAQLLRSSRLRGILRTQLMGSRGSRWNGRDSVRLWFYLCAPEGDGFIFPISQFSLCGGFTFYVETPGQDGRGPGWTPGRCWGALSPHRAF